VLGAERAKLLARGFRRLRRTGVGVLVLALAGLRAAGPGLPAFVMVVEWRLARGCFLCRRLGVMGVGPAP
jgi:hypothetical protein